MSSERKTGDKRPKVSKKSAGLTDNVNGKRKAGDMKVGKSYKPLSGNKTGVLKTKNPNTITLKQQSRAGNTHKHNDDLLVFTEKGDSPNLEFRKKGMAVHMMSFADKVGIITKGFSKKELLELRARYGLSLQSFSKIL